MLYFSLFNCVFSMTYREKLFEKRTRIEYGRIWFRNEIHSNPPEMTRDDVRMRQNEKQLISTVNTSVCIFCVIHSST